MSLPLKVSVRRVSTRVSVETGGRLLSGGEETERRRPELTVSSETLEPVRTGTV